ncbi:POK11 protein, partial [Campylorhamphus procurvoides]|nr:POK11 protein [Campylorhamphus procurvoides]
SSQRWEPVCHQSERPLQNARTVFTDAGKRTRKAAVVWASGEAGTWNSHILTAAANDSLQTLELAAVCWAMSIWIHEPLNVVTDSLYVAGVVRRIEDAVLRRSSNERLTQLFQ